jgi:hypothetical protein
MEDINSANDADMRAEVCQLFQDSLDAIYQ